MDKRDHGRTSTKKRMFPRTVSLPTSGSHCQQAMEAATPRTPLGERPVNVPVDIGHPDATCDDLLGLKDNALVPNRFESTPPGLSPTPLELREELTPPPSRRASWTQARRDRENEMRQQWRASDPHRERERNQRDYAQRREDPALVEADRERSRAARERTRENDARDSSVAELYAEADRLLERLHRCSGAPITASSMRVAHLDRGTDAYEQAVEDTLDDIGKYAHVSLLEGAECVRAFQEREDALGEMHVCAACGVRDPEAKYSAHKLSEWVTPGHWMLVDESAMARLEASPPFDLLQRRPEGEAAWPRVQVRRRDLHNVIEHEGVAYHGIQAAVRRGGSVSICASCERGECQLRIADR